MLFYIHHPSINQMALSERWGTPWTGHQFTSGLTCRQKNNSHSPICHEITCVDTSRKWNLRPRSVFEPRITFLWGSAFIYAALDFHTQAMTVWLCVDATCPWKSHEMNMNMWFRKWMNEWINIYSTSDAECFTQRSSIAHRRMAFHLVLAESLSEKQVNHYLFLNYSTKCLDPLLLTLRWNKSDCHYPFIIFIQTDELQLRCKSPTLNWLWKRGERLFVTMNSKISLIHMLLVWQWINSIYSIL